MGKVVRSPENEEFQRTIGYFLPTKRVLLVRSRSIKVESHWVDVIDTRNFTFDLTFIF